MPTFSTRKRRFHSVYVRHSMSETAMGLRHLQIPSRTARNGPLRFTQNEKYKVKQKKREGSDGFLSPSPPPQNRGGDLKAPAARSSPCEQKMRLNLMIYGRKKGLVNYFSNDSIFCRMTSSCTGTSVLPPPLCLRRALCRARRHCGGGLHQVQTAA